MKKILTTAILFTFMLTMNSCSQMKTAGQPGGSLSPEVIARDGIVGAHAALLSLEKKHPECGTVGVTDPTSGVTPWASKHSTVTICSLIDRGIGGVNLAMDATEAYCSSPTFDTQNLKCSPPAAGTPAAQQLLGKLQAAVGNMNQIMADVQTATGAPVLTPAPTPAPTPSPAPAPATPNR